MQFNDNPQSCSFRFLTWSHVETPMTLMPAFEGELDRVDRETLNLVIPDSPGILPLSEIVQVQFLNLIVGNGSDTDVVVDHVLGEGFTFYQDDLGFNPGNVVLSFL